MRSSLLVLTMTALALVAGGCSSSDDATGPGGGAGTSAGSDGAGTGGTSAAGSAGANAAGANAAGTHAAGSAGSVGGSAGSGAGAAGAGAAGAGQGGAGSGGSGQAGSGAAGAGAGGAGGGVAGSGAAGGGAAGTGGSGVTPGTPFFCPETSPFSPTLPNSVVVDDAITEKDAHWTADKVYLLSHDLAVEDHTLTIDAGTVICLFQQGNISIGSVHPGEIHINGTADKHVTITTPPDSTDPTKPYNFHGGLRVNQWMASTLSYLDIWYGGPGGGSAAWAFQLGVTSGGADPTKPFLIDHLTVGQSQTRGIEIGTPQGIDPASRVHLLGFAPVDPSGPPLGVVLDAEIRALTSITKATMVIEAADLPPESRVVKIETNITPSNLDRPADLWDLGLPYTYSGNLGIYDDSGFYKPMWTIHEGVTLGLSGTIVIGDGPGNAPGDLVVAGTKNAPVTITSNKATPAPGDWGGIKFLGYLFDPMISKIEGAQLLYGGYLFSESYVTRCAEKPFGVIAIEGTGSYVGPGVSDTTIAHSAADGLVTHASNVFNDTCTTDYSKASITFLDNAGASLAIGPCP